MIEKIDEINEKRQNRNKQRKGKGNVFASMSESPGKNIFSSEQDVDKIRHGSNYSHSDDEDYEDEINHRLDQVPENQFEEPQDFVLVNQREVQELLGPRVTLKLKYGVLNGSKLTLYDEVPNLDEGTPGDDEYDMVSNLLSVKLV